MININHLRSFYICALHGNITKAAEILHVSQPSVSQQIKLFEEELGFSLFYRNGRTLGMTAEGRTLFLKAKSVFDSIVSVEDFLENRKDYFGNVTIYASQEIERPFLAKITTALMKSSAFQSSSFFVNSILEMEKTNFSNNEFSGLYLTHTKIKTMKLVQEFKFPIKLISSIQNADMGSVKTGNLKALISRLGQRLLIPSAGHTLRAELEKHVSFKELKIQTLLESNIMACLTQSVREGLGCSLLPIQYVYDDIKKNRLSVYGPPNGFWEYSLFLYSPTKEVETTAKEVVRVIQNFTIEKGG